MIFVLAVVIIALRTDGYFYGILAAVASVFTVNYAFTYPYAKLDFTIYGYPLTFLTMLTVGCAISTLMSRLKEQENLRLEAQSEKLRANLLRSVSHDLRTPLTSISGGISAVLEDEGMTADQRNALLSDALEYARWLYRMVENLLTITKITDVEISHLHRSSEVLEEIISSAVANFRKHEPSAVVKVKVPEEILFVPADALLIEQVLLNLLYNAVQHGQTTTCIRIEACRRGDMAEVSVTDDGRGFSRETLENLFRGSLSSLPEQEADRTRGMGIGMMVCQAIVEAHGGQIRAENTGHGARVAFTMPLGGTELEYPR